MRLRRFVPDKACFIRRYTSSDQWVVVQSKSNPADLISLDVSGNNLIKSNLWSKVPKFLSNRDCVSLVGNFVQSISSDDDEVNKGCSVFTGNTTTNPSKPSIINSRLFLTGSNSKLE